jgi:hypothetical protein
MAYYYLFLHIGMAKNLENNIYIYNNNITINILLFFILTSAAAAAAAVAIK